MLANRKYAAFLLSYHAGIVKELPIASPLARAPATAADDYTDVDQLVAVYETDPYLTAKILGAAHSIFFNDAHATLCTVRAALERVGVQHAVRLLQGARSAHAGYPAEQLDLFWQHSMHVATIAKELAQIATTVESSPDTAFTVALMHDIGWLVELSYDPMRVSTPAHFVGGLDDDRAGPPEHYATLGESLASAWCLPALLRDAIRWHHAPGDCPGADSRALCAITCLAERLLLDLLTGKSLQREQAAQWLEMAGIPMHEFLRLQTTYSSRRALRAITTTLVQPNDPRVGWFERIGRSVTRQTLQS